MFDWLNFQFNSLYYVQKDFRYCDGDAGGTAIVCQTWR